MEHWKVGEGFAIRYGGYKDIQWFFGDDFRARTAGLPIPPVHPVAVALEAIKAAALFLQWWEMRKSNALAAAQFEERRIPWIADMLAVMAGELAESRTIRLDTLFYLDREISRFLEHAEEQRLVDVPSSLLLQFERTAEVLTTISQTIDKELPLSALSPLHSAEPRFRYREFCEFEGDPSMNGLQLYLEAAAKTITARPGVAMLFALLFPVSALSAGLMGTATWMYSQQKQTQHEEHLAQFYALYRMGFEVRSLHALLSAAAAFPPLVRRYSVADVLEGGAGERLGQITAHGG